jgi:MtN3 and saliva related transmembrane protein
MAISMSGIDDVITGNWRLPQYFKIDEDSNMDRIQTVGIIGSTISCIACCPQVLKTFRTKRTKDLSVWHPIMTLFANVFWIYYGLSTKAVPVMMTTTFVCSCSVMLLLMKCRYDKPIVSGLLRHRTFVSTPAPVSKVHFYRRHRPCRVR